MVMLPTTPRSENLGTLVRQYGELEFLSGCAMTRRLLRVQLGLGTEEDGDHRSSADRDRVDRVREAIMAAIRP